MSFNLQKSMTWNVEILSGSFLKNIKLSPQTGGNSLSLANSQASVVFEIPATNVISLYDLQLSFTRGASTPEAGNQQFIYNSFFPYINRVELFSANNEFLVNVFDVDKYTKLHAPLNLNPNTRNQNCGFMYNSDRILNNSGANGAANNTLLINSLDTDCFDWSDAPLLVNENPFNIASHTLSDFSNIIAEDINTSIPAEIISIKLRDLLPDTIFNVKKQIYLSRSIYLRLWFNPVNKWGFNLNVGMGPLLIITTSNLTFVSPISNISLSVMYQGNPSVVQAITDASNTLEQIIMPELTLSTIQLSNTNQTSSVKIVSNSPFSRLYKTYIG